MVLAKSGASRAHSPALNARYLAGVYIEPSVVITVGVCEEHQNGLGRKKNSLKENKTSGFGPPKSILCGSFVTADREIVPV